MLQDLGFDAWTIPQAKLAGVVDEDVAVHAHDQGAALVSQDKQFMERRRGHTIGQHIHVRGPAYAVGDVLLAHMDLLRLVLEHREHVVIDLSATQMRTYNDEG